MKRKNYGILLSVELPVLVLPVKPVKLTTQISKILFALLSSARLLHLQHDGVKCFVLENSKHAVASVQDGSMEIL